MGQGAELAEQACAAGRCEEAIDLLEREIRRQPGNPRLYRTLGLCYSGGCRPHSLADADMAVSYLRQALRLSGEDRGPLRADILDALGNSLIRCRLAPRESALREALACHREAAEIYQTSGSSDDWARAEFNLGNACCDLADITAEDRWGEAISHYENALRIRTRDKDPERHAAVLENLGGAWRRLPAGDGRANVRKCIDCYRRALRIFAPATHPEKNAGLQNNLGNAFLSLPETDERTAARNARRALAHFDRALRVQADKGSRVYGITQYNRAQAFVRLSRASPAANLGMAADCLREACRAFESCGEARYRRVAQDQLASILPSGT